MPGAAANGTPISGLISVQPPAAGSSSEPASVTSRGRFGNAILTRFPVLTARLSI